MPFNGNSNYAIRAERWCKTCGVKTPQISCGCNYSTPEQFKVPSVMVRSVTWVCQWCDQAEIEAKEVAIPTDRLKIIRRFLSLSEEYDLLGLKVEATADELVFRLRLPDFDMGEMRAIRYKQQETGFITADELLQLQKAGFSRSREVPPAPEPRDSATIRERAKRRVLEPKPWTM